MNPKMKRALEAALYRVLYEALCKIDATYPRRRESDDEYILHMQAVRVVMGWYDDAVYALRNTPDLKPRPVLRRRPIARPISDAEDEWDLLTMLFMGLLGGVAAFGSSIGLEALPQDVAVMLRTVSGIVQLGVQGQMQICLRELQTLGDTLNDDRGRRMGGASSTTRPIPSPSPNQRKDIEQWSADLADRMKRLLGPLDASKKPQNKKSSGPT